MKTIVEVIKELPPDLQKEVEDFVRYLMAKRENTHKGKPKFRWAGALRDLRNQYTSVELQHKIAEWRIGTK